MSDASLSNLSLSNPTTKTLFIFTDGGSRGNPGPAAAGVVIYAVESAAKLANPAPNPALPTASHLLTTAQKFLGVATNNEAEYQAFLLSLEWLKTYLETNRVSQIKWKLDSLLVVEQLNRHWKIKEVRLQPLAQMAWVGLKQLALPYTISHVPRADNSAADQVVNDTLDAQAMAS